MKTTTRPRIYLPLSAMFRNTALRLTILSGVLLPGSAIWGADTFTSIDVPGATSTGAAGQILGVGARGDISGNYRDAQGIGHGFLFSGGSFFRIDVPFPGATTLLEGINSAGVIVGGYSVPGFVHGFVLSDGNFTKTDDFPGAFITHPLGINPEGQIVGRYAITPGVFHGFLLSGGSFTTIEPPGATASQAIGISATGDIVGTYTMSGVSHAFVLTGGSFTTIDPPGAVGGLTAGTLTAAEGINPEGQIVGKYSDGTQHGWLLSQGVYTKIDFPGASATSAEGINPEGAVVGSYVSADGKRHAYLLSK